MKMVTIQSGFHADFAHPQLSPTVSHSVKLAIRLQAEEDERARYAQRLELNDPSSRQPMTSASTHTPESKDTRGLYPHAPPHKHLQPIDISAALAIRAENTTPSSKNSVQRQKHVPKSFTEKRRDCVVM